MAFIFFVLTGSIFLADHPDARKRVAEIIAPALLERCATILSDHVAHGRHRAGEDGEIVRMLGKLVDVQFRKGVLRIPECSSGCCEVGLIRALTANHFFPSDPVKNLILSGPSAHLFFLYAPICDCLSAGQDGEVEVLVKRALKKMGHDMGLN